MQPTTRGVLSCRELGGMRARGTRSAPSACLAGRLHEFGSGYLPPQRPMQSTNVLRAVDVVWVQDNERRHDCSAHERVGEWLGGRRYMEGKAGRGMRRSRDKERRTEGVSQLPFAFMTRTQLTNDHGRCTRHLPGLKICCLPFPLERAGQGGHKAHRPRDGDTQTRQCARRQEAGRDISTLVIVQTTLAARLSRHVRSAIPVATSAPRLNEDGGEAGKCSIRDSICWTEHGLYLPL